MTMPTWEQCCKALGKSELIEDARFVTPALRSENRSALREEITSVTRNNTKAHWIATMTEMGVPCGPINAINETFAEPQVEHLGMKRSVNHSDIGNFDIVRQPINMTAAKHPNSLEPAPNPGQHTDDVLRALNYDDATIKALRKRGIV